MLSAIAILDFTIVVGVTRAFQKRFSKVDCIVEVVIIHITTIDVDLAFEFGSQCLPVSFKNVYQVIVFSFQ